MRMFCETVSTLSALWMSLRHCRALGIRRGELKRYYLKTLNLALCYRGFVTTRSVSDSMRCGQAAFYCCAYDVITDWRHFDSDRRDWYAKLLRDNLPEKIATLALNLYRDEYENRLKWDGLSRGSVALEFISRLIGNFDELDRQMNVERLGILLQIVDDVLDIEDDIRENSINCLLSPARYRYLRMLDAFDFTGLASTLPYARILVTVCQAAQNRARQLLKSGSLKESNHISGCPKNEIDDEEPREVVQDVYAYAQIIDRHGI